MIVNSKLLELRPKEQVLEDVRRCLNHKCDECPGKNKHNGPFQTGECQWPIRLISAAHDIISGENTSYANEVLAAHINALRQINKICIPYLLNNIDYASTIDEIIEENSLLRDALSKIDDLTRIDVSEIPLEVETKG